MSVRYVLAPEAALDLVQIWHYIGKQSSSQVADRVESAIRDKIIFLAGSPGAGRWRKNLTDQHVKFFPVYSYLIVYRPETQDLCRSSPFSMAVGTWNRFSRVASEVLRFDQYAGTGVTKAGRKELIKQFRDAVHEHQQRGLRRH